MEEKEDDFDRATFKEVYKVVIKEMAMFESASVNFHFKIEKGLERKELLFA